MITNAAFRPKVASEALSEHLICKIFLGQHTPTPPYHLHAYACTITVHPPNLNILPPPLDHVFLGNCNDGRKQRKGEKKKKRKKPRSSTRENERQSNCRKKKKSERNLKITRERRLKEREKQKKGSWRRREKLN